MNLLTDQRNTASFHPSLSGHATDRNGPLSGRSYRFKIPLTSLLGLVKGILFRLTGSRKANS